MVAGSTCSYGRFIAVASANGDSKSPSCVGSIPKFESSLGASSQGNQACDGADCNPQEDLLTSQAPAAAAYPGQPAAVEAATTAAEDPASPEAPVPTAEPEAQRRLKPQVHLLRGSGSESLRTWKYWRTQIPTS